MRHRLTLLLGSAVAAALVLAPALVPAPAQAAPTTGSSSPAVFRTAGALDTTAPAVRSTAGKPATVRYVAPPVGSASFELDPTTVEAYTYWASGVTGTLAGFAPGEAVTVTDTAPSGAVQTFERLTADADGTLVHRFTSKVIDAGVGRHQLLAVGQQSQRSAAALLDVTRNAGQTLTVRATPVSLSQDAFLRGSVTVRAEGLQPRERVFFNLFGPDGSGQGVGLTESLRADARGVFTYSLRSSTIDVATGEWTASIIGASSSQNGSTTFTITPTPPAAPRGSITLGGPLTLAAFTRDGLPFSLAGLKPFDAFDLQLTTPTGDRVPFGAARSTGVGGYRDRILVDRGTVPLGTYTLTATSRSTGSRVAGTFAITTPDGVIPPNSSMVVTPTTLTAAALEDPAGGISVAVSHIPASSSVSVGLLSPDGYYVPLRDGLDPVGSRFLFTTSTEAGTADFRMTSTRLWQPGSYRLEVSYSGGGLQQVITVTAGAAGATTPGQSTQGRPNATTAPTSTAPTSTAPTPARPTTAAPTSAPSPAASSTAAPTAAPTTSAAPTTAPSTPRPPVVGMPRPGAGAPTTPVR